MSPGKTEPVSNTRWKEELVTVIETVVADGTVVSPLVINKGAGHYMGLYKI